MKGAAATATKIKDASKLVFNIPLQQLQLKSGWTDGLPPNLECRNPEWSVWVDGLMGGWADWYTGIMSLWACRRLSAARKTHELQAAAIASTATKHLTWF